MKTNKASFNAVTPDMKLEQTIKRFKKGAGGLLIKQDKVHFFS